MPLPGSDTRFSVRSTNWINIQDWPLAMPKLTPQPMDLLCPACGWSRTCGPLEMLEQLRAANMLRLGASVEGDLLLELFSVAAGKATCPDCGRVGLMAAPEDHSKVEWPSGRKCDLCGSVIARERLQVLPGAKHCAECQEEQENDRGETDVDYCPRCGGLRHLRPNRSGGVTKYAMFCPACHR